MQHHDNFFTFQADNNYDLGLQLGAHFKEVAQARLNRILRDDAWALKLKRSMEYLSVTKESFPHYVQEIEGYAKGAGVDFLECWTRSFEDQFSFYREDHCTSIVTNDGKLISHNEDWANPIQDFKRLKSMKRATGYNHNIISMDGKIWNIESTAKEQIMVEPAAPFVHTNHYLSEQLKPLEAEKTQSTFRRYEVASESVRPHMSEQELMKLVSDTSQGPDLSIFNERTIARMIVDLEQRIAKIWLLREAAKGWVEYPLEFIVKSGTL